MQIFTILLIALSLSTDAFSLSILYGSRKMSNKEIYTLSLLVGIFHFFMPLLGRVIGNELIAIFITNIKLIVMIIFTIIGLDMVTSSFKNKEEKVLKNIFEYFLFALTVSIDSFTIGIVIKQFTNNLLMASFIFFVFSSFFTYIGLIIGEKINKIIGSISTLFGGILLIMIGLFSFFL